MSYKLFLNGLYQPEVHALQIPTSENNINLVVSKLIIGAHKRGIDVHYWKINDPEVMENLINLGADGIMTDYLDLLIKKIEYTNY